MILYNKNGDNMEKIKLKFESYVSSLDRLKEAIDESKNNNDSVVIDGTIQRFEFVVELSWKLIKIYLEYEGLGEFNSPRSSIKEAYKVGLIEDGEVWLDMLTDRNLTSHTYDEQLAKTIYSNIVNKYYDQLYSLKETMRSKI